MVKIELDDILHDFQNSLGCRYIDERSPAKPDYWNATKIKSKVKSHPLSIAKYGNEGC